MGEILNNLYMDKMKKQFGERLYYILEFTGPEGRVVGSHWTRKTPAGANLTWYEAWQVVTSYPEFAEPGFTEWQVYREDPGPVPILVCSIRIFK